MAGAGSARDAQEQTLRGVGLADAELRYMAPELLTGQSADVRSDVFTMGVLATRWPPARCRSTARRCRSCWA